MEQMANSCKLVMNTQRALLLKTISLNLCRFQSSGSRQLCPEYPDPRCSPKELAKSPCALLKKAHAEGTKEKYPWDYLFVKPECCPPCADAFPRFDDLYYKPSDKVHRIYTQTWLECPDKISKKPSCDLTKLIYPVLERRPRKSRAKAAKAGCENNLGLMKCRRIPNAACPKVFMPGCKGSRIPPTCRRARKQLICKKRCCPYPSYSECKRDKTRPKRVGECTCNDPFSMCEVYGLKKEHHS